MAEDIRNLGLAAAAVIGVPFLVWRSIVAQKQVDVAEQGHITDRINKAVEGLGAEKTVKRQRRNLAGNLLYADDNEGKPDFKKPVMEEITEPNLEVRIGAIYALERISQDSERDHIKIMEILCAYIRNNSPASAAKSSPHETFKYLTDKGMDPEQAYSDNRYKTVNTGGWIPTELNESTLIEWAESLPRLRQDIQVALYVIGRRSERQKKIEQRISVSLNKRFRLDLSYTCLQRADLGGLDLSNTLFRRSNLQGAYAGGANLEGVNLRDSNIEPLFFDTVDMRGCYLRRTKADYSSLFAQAKLEGAFIRQADLERSRLTAKDLAQIYGDHEVKIGHLDRPKHWPSSEQPWHELQKSWRAWQKESGFQPPEIER